jgi:hypothetical protein
LSLYPTRGWCMIDVSGSFVSLTENPVGSEALSYGALESLSAV